MAPERNLNCIVPSSWDGTKNDIWTGFLGSNKIAPWMKFQLLCPVVTTDETELSIEYEPVCPVVKKFHHEKDLNQFVS